MIARVHLNSGLHELPQYVSDDRQRARRAHCRKARAQFEWEAVSVPLPLLDGELSLPGRCKRHPPVLRHSPATTAHLAIDRTKMRVEARITRLRRLRRDPRCERHYEQLFGPFAHPPNRALDNWRSDLEFGRQQLNGVNPMRIRRVLGGDPALASEEVKQAIVASTGQTLDALLGDQRLFKTEYSALASPELQAVAERKREQARIDGRRPAWLAAPTCVLWDDGAQLVPLTIQLEPPHADSPNPAYTPGHPRNSWLVARAHVQAAAGLAHESIHHLLETHLINEAIAVGLYRQIHEDHPLRQLLDPHYEGTLAQNYISRGSLLAPGGAFDTAIVTGVEGGMLAIAQYYDHWRWADFSLDNDLAARGFGPDQRVLHYYYYACDATPVHHAIARFVERYLRIWYRSDEDVCMDYELHGFLAEVSNPEQGNVKGFPTSRQINSVAALESLITDMIFRAGPQHSAVNNGQYDAYGFVPNNPGIVHRQPPQSVEEPVSDRELWEAMPTLDESIQQKSMAWILSRPTDRTLLHAGESPVFDASVCAELRHILRGFRRRLQNISERIVARNERLPFPYVYLDPRNISRSTDT
ncbi:MAG: lipoxygenase family protein [Enhygromyxa sp.]